MLITRLDDIRDFRLNGELSDICVSVDKTDFFLHKFPLFLNSEFFRGLCRSGMADTDRVSLAHFPGGAKTFSTVADFCYGLEIDIKSTNVVELRCAAEFLQMTSKGNLASETNAEILRILRGPTSASALVNVLSSCCRMGAIASQTNILSLCFETILKTWKKENLPEKVMEMLLELPHEWFIGLIVGARDESVPLPKIARLAGQYLTQLVRQNKVDIDRWRRMDLCHSRLEKDARNFGELIDAILVELPESTALSEAMDDEVLCLLLQLTKQLECKCEPTFLTAISKNLKNVPHEILVTVSTSIMASIADHSVHKNTISPSMLCETVDRYLWDRITQNGITVNEFTMITQAIPKSYRPQHDSLLLIIEQLFQTEKLSDETKVKVLDSIDAYRLHEETLRKVSASNVIPSSFIVSSALAVASRLRSELTIAKGNLAEKDNAIQKVYTKVSDAIAGQWKQNDAILNVTPKDTSNTRVQFVKVLPRALNASLSMEHQVYNGRLTLCVRSSREASTQEILFFDPFNKQLLEIKRSKHDNLMVGEHYEKVEHKTAYWPFSEVAS